MLKIEEEKAMRKIDETRRKADKISKLKEENEKRYELKVNREKRSRRTLSHTRDFKFKEYKRTLRSIKTKQKRIQS